MSVQVAKSTSGTTPTAGRRTPLSLSGSVGKSSKVQQSASDAEKDSSSQEVSTTLSSKTASKNENSTTDSKKTNDKNDKKNANVENQTTENTNTSAKEKSIDEKKKEDKKKDKDSVKKDDKKQENGVNEGKDSSKTNGHKDDDKKNEKNGEKSEKSTGHRESSRQKELREQKEKEKEQELKESKENEKTSTETKKADDKKTASKSEDSEQKSGKKKEDVTEKPITKNEQEKEPETKKKTRKEPETPKKDEKKSREKESITPNKESIHKQPISNQSIASLAMERDLKGFTPDGDEMESLIFDAESDPNGDGGPTETSTPGKILKMKQSPTPSLQKTSTFPSYEHRETYEKYESVSLKEDKRDTASIAANTPLERPKFTSSYRAISGRRSLRPVKEYSFQSTYRESYRKINTELDYTSSSMNVTVGSEVSNESSFSIFGRGKKRERTPPVTSTNDSIADTQMDVELSPKSPKRARLDFSGIFGIVSSPVTLLRTKLSRTKIQCSTPNGKVTSTTKDEEDGVESVSVIATEEMASNDIADASEDVNIKDAGPQEKDDLRDNAGDNDDIEIPGNLESKDFKKSQPITVSMESVNKRRMCSVM